MRIRLIVQRNGLPPVRVLWNLPTSQGPPGPGTTIANLLEQVNEIIPLESNDWGLEDYIVEVKGFECLHFADICNVLKEDDKICIRPLQTYDFRARKISGRTQITEDGKHLIDGVPFGRPFLRKLSRPAIKFPPRKRQRLQYAQDNDELEGADEQLLIQNEAWENNNAENDGIDNHEVELPNDAESTQRQEFQRLVNESRRATERLLSEAPSGVSKPAQIMNPGEGLRLKLSNNHEDDQHYSTPYENPLLEEYYNDEPSGQIGLSNAAVSFGGKRESLGVLSGRKRGKMDERVHTRRQSTGSMRSVHFEDEEETPATIQLSESDSGDDDDDEDYDPAANDQSSDKENTEPDETAYIAGDVESTTSSSDYTSSESSDSDITSSALSTSSSDDSPSEASALEYQSLPDKTKKASTTTKLHTHSEAAATQSQKPAPATTNVPPGHGQLKTSTRNQRRRDAKRLRDMKSKGFLSPNATREDLETFMTPPEAPDQTHHLHDEADSVAIKESASGASNLAAAKKLTAESNEDFPFTEAVLQVEDSQPGSNAHTKTPVIAKGQAASHDDGLSTGASDVAPRRSRLDIASSRRLLFGSLGLPTPKTKEDEAKLRQQLQEKSQIGMRQRDPSKGNGLADAEDADDESWRDKIELSAVECWEEGVKLSTPPFPFEQYWDSKEKKRKRRSRISNVADEDLSGLSVPEVSEVYDFNSNQGLYPHEHYHQISLSTDSLEDDLPSLPSDMSKLQKLHKDDCQPGLIIAFMQLELSSDTGWQPKVSSYRTGKIETILEDESLQISLARRDVTFKYKQFDVQTGKRIYENLEMPGYDEDNLESDSSKLVVSFSELIEPLIVERPEVSGVSAETGAINGNIRLEAQNGDGLMPTSSLSAPSGQVSASTSGPMDTANTASASSSAMVGQSMSQSLDEALQDLPPNMSSSSKDIQHERQVNAEEYLEKEDLGIILHSQEMQIDSSAPADNHNKSLASDTRSGNVGIPGLLQYDGASDEPPTENETSQNGTSPAAGRRSLTGNGSSQITTRSQSQALKSEVADSVDGSQGSTKGSARTSRQRKKGDTSLSSQMNGEAEHSSGKSQFGSNPSSHNVQVNGSQSQTKSPGRKKKTKGVKGGG